MRLSLCALATLVAFAAISPVAAQAPSEVCGPTADATTPPNAGSYMTGMNMAVPMSGQMKRDDMTMGQVAQSAAQKEKCMSDALKLEERTMDGRKQ